MTRRYTALRIVGTIYKLLGVVAAILTIVAIIAMIVGLFGSGLIPGRFYGLRATFAALGALVYGTILTLTLYAFGEGIYLLIALEENTRLTREILQRQSPSRLDEASEG